MSIADNDISEKNGVKMTMELCSIADLKITEEKAALIWNALTTAEKIDVCTQHEPLTRNSKHV